MPTHRRHRRASPGAGRRTYPLQRLGRDRCLQQVGRHGRRRDLPGVLLQRRDAWRCPAGWRPTVSCCFLRQRRAPDVARAGGYVFPAALHDRLVGRNTGNLLWTIENLRRKLGDEQTVPGTASSTNPISVYRMPKSATRRLKQRCVSRAESRWSSGAFTDSRAEEGKGALARCGWFRDAAWFQQDARRSAARRCGSCGGVFDAAKAAPAAGSYPAERELASRSAEMLGS